MEFTQEVSILPFFCLKLYQNLKMSNEDRKANALNRNTPDNTQIEWTEDICETATLKIFLLLSKVHHFLKIKLPQKSSE